MPGSQIGTPNYTWTWLGSWLTLPRGALPLALLGAALGGLAALGNYDPRFLLGTAGYWTLAPGDTGTNLVGWIYFLKDQWRLPLFHVATLGYPEGASIVFTDSIPLLALPAKVLFKLSGVTFNYFGPWFLLCFVLHGAVSSLLLHKLSVRGWLDNASGVLVALSAPILLFRFGHISLTGQFLILASIFFYFATRNKPLRAGMMSAWVALHGAALLVHAYLFAMMAPFFLLSLFEHRRRGAGAGNQARTWLAVFVGVSLGVVVTAGYFSWQSPFRPQRGYGHFSMNLLAPFSGDPNLHAVTIFGNATRDATGGQYEGYNYLGFGTLVLVGYLAIARRQEVKKKLLEYRGLVVVSALMVFFAITHHVYLGGLEIIRIPLGGDILTILSTFHASGRFFWPVFYLITFGALSLCRTSGRTRETVALIVLAALLQVEDTRKIRSMNLARSRQESPALADLASRQELIGRHAAVFKYPSSHCEGWGKLQFDVELQQVSGRVGVPINSAYLARPNKNCTRETETLAQAMKPSTLYIFTAQAPQSVVAEANRAKCLRFQHGLMCSDQWRPGDANLLARWR